MIQPAIAIEKIRAAIESGAETGKVCADACYGYVSALRDALNQQELGYAVQVQPCHAE